MLIHATITVSGDKAQLGDCELRLRRLLSAQSSENEVTEHHGAEALCYDLKVAGGIPFPAFVQASQEFPGLEFTAEWVNVAAGERGGATIVNGRVTGQSSERLTPRAGDDHPLYVAAEANGRLKLALTLFRASREEWRGYALTATRDALLRVLRLTGSDKVEIYATEGAPEWTLAWRGELSSRRFAREVLQRPVAIDEAVYRELDRLARSFAAKWIWFASGPREEIAIEQERYARSGFEAADANLRSAQWHDMKTAAPQSSAPLEYSTLAADEHWLRDLVLATWAKEG